MSVSLWSKTLLGAAFAALFLAGCGDKPSSSGAAGSAGAASSAFQATDVTGAPIGSDPAKLAEGPFLTLTDHTGKPRSLADFRGKVVVLFFGYTHCPDVCPTTMSELASAMKQLGPEAAKQVQVLFVSVDPERDPPELLAKYVPAFDPSFIGLSGSPAEVAAVADRFKIVYQKVKGSDEKNYTVDHSAGSYIFDKTGKLRLFVSYGAGAKVFAHDIGLLLKS